MYYRAMKIAVPFLALFAVLGTLSGMWFCERMSEACLEIGYQRSMSLDPKGAIGFYDTAVLLNPRNAAAYLNRGQSKRLIGEPIAALKDFDQAVQLGDSSQFLSAACAVRGSIMDELGYKSAAIEDYSTAIKLDDHIASQVLYERAAARAALGDSKGALLDYNMCISKDSGNYEAYFQRGYLRSKLGDRAGAISDIRKLLELNPPDKASLVKLLNDLEKCQSDQRGQKPGKKTGPATSSDRSSVSSGPVC